MTRHNENAVRESSAEYYWEDGLVALSPEEVDNLIDDHDSLGTYRESGVILSYDEALALAIAIDEEGDPDLARDLARGF